LKGLGKIGAIFDCFRRSHRRKSSAGHRSLPASVPKRDVVLTCPIACLRAAVDKGR